MSEADVQCALYLELAEHYSGARKVISMDVNGKKLHDWKYQVLTRSVHAELFSKRRKRTEFVDLCLIVPPETEFWIAKSKFSRENREMPLWKWDWHPECSIGIEIKFNQFVPKTKIYYYNTKRERETEKWKNYKLRLVRDLKKLNRYKRGWLIFVDQYSLISNKKEWRDFIDGIIRESNYGWAKKTLNAYYLCPTQKKALSYKPPYKAF